MDMITNKISLDGMILNIKIYFIGFILSESVFFSQIFILNLKKEILTRFSVIHTIIFLLIYFSLILIYLFYRGAHSEVIKLLKSKRLDLLLVFTFGILSSIYLGGIGLEKYKEFTSILSPNQSVIIITLPFVLILSFLVRALFIWIGAQSKKRVPFFINDDEKKLSSEDLFDISEIASRFAERVINLKSKDSLVFGIDGPWGIGKSSFINYCMEYWKNKHNNYVIVYTFNPLKYESRDNLFEKFIDGLIKTLQICVFMPELKPIVSRYSRLIKGVRGSFLNFFNFEVFGDNYSTDNAFNDLEAVLASIDKKIIIVIDDLDRLNLSAIKDLLFTVKKSFTLPNISYVLCYDTENISSLEQKQPSIEKITEFLEKFVNVKVSLFLSSTKLIEYVRNLQKTLSGNSQADPLLVSKAIEGLIDIFKSNEYHRYVGFIGDIRKLKRLINTILLLDLEKTDFENSDINNHDLIHLMLIYINYPSIFRKIYNCETDGKKGFFSLVSKYEAGYPKDDKKDLRLSDSEYRNSIDYNEYIKSDVLSYNQRYLLNKLFNESRIEQKNRGNISEELRTSLACFNGDIWSKDSRNLEEYLNLIVKSSKPQTTEQYRFYLNQKEYFIRGKKIEEIISNEAFSYMKSESNQKQLWKVLINSAHEYEYGLGSSLISYLMNNITNYAHFENDDVGLGLRHDLSFYLAKLLDQTGWIDENGKHRVNMEENLGEISEWIFGEGRHKDHGVIQILPSKDRGILGFYDLLSFRLFCSADRGGDLFNLQRSLSTHGNVSSPSSGLVQKIAIEEMREISQKIFKVFQQKYIKLNINIFESIDRLTIQDFSGKYFKYIKAKIESNEIKDPDKTIEILKTHIKMFITFQLGGSSTEHGITCGYYDTKGKKDRNGIKKLMNKYIFDVCFNPGNGKKNVRNYEYFLDYLLTCFVDTIRLDSHRNYIPSVSGFTKFLDRDSLIKYWKTNRNKIKSLHFELREKKVVNGNYIASYKEDLSETYKTLDGMLKEKKILSKKNKIKQV